MHAWLLWWERNRWNGEIQVAEKWGCDGIVFNEGTLCTTSGAEPGHSYCQNLTLAAWKSPRGVVCDTKQVNCLQRWTTLEWYTLKFGGIHPEVLRRFYLPSHGLANSVWVAATYEFQMIIDDQLISSYYNLLHKIFICCGFFYWV